MHYVMQAELAAALRLGEESFLFIDDNPAECAAVRAALPHVPAWCFPQARHPQPHVPELATARAEGCNRM